VQAVPVHAIVIGAKVVVIQSARRLEHAVAAPAEVLGAGIAVIANGWRVRAVAAQALVNGARVVVSAVDRSVLAVAVHAGIRSAGVAIIAVDGNVGTVTVHLAEVFRARVVVIAF